MARRRHWLGGSRPGNCPLSAPSGLVYGNIDGQDIRRLYPQTNRFTVDGAEVLIKHIGGYPGNYDPSIRGSLLVKPPQLFISGHSHILKVKYDKNVGYAAHQPGSGGNVRIS